MALSKYTGRTPADDERVIGRVSRHHQWTVADDDHETCAQCDTELSLDERHLLVTLRARPGGGATRRYLCDESCLGEWVE